MGIITKIQHHVEQILSWRRGALNHRPALSKTSRPRVEQLEPRLLLHASPIMDAEHIAVFGVRDSAGVITGGLIPDASITYEALAKVDGMGNVVSQNWSDPGAWLHVSDPSNGGVPGPGDNVLIPYGT